MVRFLSCKDYSNSITLDESSIPVEDDLPNFEDFFMDESSKPVLADCYLFYYLRS